MKNNKTAKWIGLGLTVALAIFGIGKVWGTLTEDVEANTTKIEVVSEKADKTEKAVIRIETKLEHIKETTDRIEKKL